MLRTIRSVAAVLGAVLALSCGVPSERTTVASIDPAAILPLRADASGNADRLTYGLVRCRGQDAAPALTGLAALARGGGLRRRGAMLTADGQGVPGTDRCAVDGDYMLGGQAFLALFGDRANGPGADAARRLFWKAIRAGGEAAAFDPGFQTFLRESLGAELTPAAAAAALAVGDRLYGAAAARPDDAEVGTAYLLGLAAQEADRFIMGLQSLSPTERAAAAGLADSLTLLSDPSRRGDVARGELPLTPVAARGLWSTGMRLTPFMLTPLTSD